MTPTASSSNDGGRQRQQKQRQQRVHTTINQQMPGIGAEMALVATSAVTEAAAAAAYVAILAVQMAAGMKAVC
jgi:hypothetical protein